MPSAQEDWQDRPPAPASRVAFYRAVPSNTRHNLPYSTTRRSLFPTEQVDLGDVVDLLLVNA
jgi:hypothetical protein